MVPVPYQQDPLEIKWLPCPVSKMSTTAQVLTLTEREVLRSQYLVLAVHLAPRQKSGIWTNSTACS